jgi:hypothetical protein
MVICVPLMKSSLSYVGISEGPPEGHQKCGGQKISFFVKKMARFVFAVRLIISMCVLIIEWRWNECCRDGFGRAVHSAFVIQALQHLKADLVANLE